MSFRDYGIISQGEYSTAESTRKTTWKNHAGKVDCFQTNVSAIPRTSCLTGVTTKIVFHHYPGKLIIQNHPVFNNLTNITAQKSIRLRNMGQICFCQTVKFQSFWLISLSQC